MIKGTTNILKVPDGLIGRARKRDILAEAMFYYAIKSLSLDGFVRKSDIKTKVMRVYPKSYSTICRMLNKLKSLGWIIPEENGYSIVSYNKFFGSFGYNMSPKYVSGVVARLGSFGIHKISVEFITEIQEAIEVVELKAAMIRKAKRSMPKPNMMSAVRRRSNIDPHMSCLGVAKMFGYKSKSAGHAVEVRLVKHGFIEKYNRNSLVSVNPLDIENHANRHRGGYYVADGALFKVEMNKMMPLI